MQVQSQQNLEAPKRGEYQVKASDWISKGFDFMKENMGVMIGYGLVVFGIAMVAQLVPIIGPLISSFVISPSLLVGFYLFAYRHDKGENPDFSTFFDGFQYLGKILPIMLLQMVIILALLIPAMIVIGVSSAALFAGEGNIDTILGPGLFIGVLLVVVPTFYLGISWIYAYPLAIFHGLPAWESMETSRKMMTPHFWSWFGFFFLLGLIMMGGALLLGIGLLFAYPVYLYAQYVGYREITNLMETDTEDDLLEHLVE